jgi:ribosomal-protein-serine acetyltransferase
MPQPELRIRPYTADDGPAFFAAALESVGDLEPWMPWCHPSYSLEEANAWVRLQAQSFEKQSEFEFLIMDKSRAIVGACGINQIDTRNRRANVGYWVRSSAIRRGNAIAAIRLLVTWAVANTDLQRLEIVAAIENTPSLRVAEKVGAFREAVLRNRLLLHGRFHDAVMFTFIRGENMAG